LLFKVKVEELISNEPPLVVADGAAGSILWTSRFLREQGKNVKTMLVNIKGIRHVWNLIISEVPESAYYMLKSDVSSSVT